MFELFGYVSAALSILMIAPYVRDIFRGGTQPQRASWFIWTVLGVIAFASQWAKGADDSLWLVGGQTFAVGVVFLLSIRYGTGGFEKRDVRALIAASIGLFLWYLTDEAAFALAMVIFVDSVGSLLTLLKSYRDPGSETLSTWLISGTSGIFGALAVGGLDPILLAYPMYIVIANYSIATALLLGRRRE